LTLCFTSISASSSSPTTPVSSSSRCQLQNTTTDAWVGEENIGDWIWK
jgi:hypothetical protein